MTANPSRNELVARLEAAHAGTDALDHAVLTFLRIAPQYDAEGQYPAHMILPSLQRFTRVEAAALSLVSPTAFISARRFSDGWYVTIKRHSSVDEGQHRGDQKPLALALCIAAIKAMP